MSTRLLSWAPPALDASRRVVELTAADASNRVIELNAGEDCEIRFLEPLGYVPGPYHAAQDTIVTVIGGRHVVSMGAQFRVDSHLETSLTASVGPEGLTLHVMSTEGFPEAGIVRVQGEGIRYSSKTDASFAVAERNYGFFAGTAGEPPLALVAGAKVYLGEFSRGGLSFRTQTGLVHVEGALIEGLSLLDGVRLRGSSTTVRIQQSRIGPNRPLEAVSQEDGHADAIQTWGAGVKALQMSHVSLLGGVNGRCIINAANTSGGGAVELIEFRDSECIDWFGRRQSLVTNSDAETKWVIANGWLVTKKARVLAAPELWSEFGLEWTSPRMQPMIPRTGLGVGYETVGYAA